MFACIHVLQHFGLEGGAPRVGIDSILVNPVTSSVVTAGGAHAVEGAEAGFELLDLSWPDRWHCS